MNRTCPGFDSFALIREMLETPQVIRQFDHKCVTPFLESIRHKGRLFLTGEGSSRIFPAKNAMAYALRHGLSIPVLSEGARQAMEYDLSGHAVFAASNSGRTNEAVVLFSKLREMGHDALFGLTANSDSVLEAKSKRTHVLSCGTENAVAATKSVMEQALFYQCLIGALSGLESIDLEAAAKAIEGSLMIEIDRAIIEKLTAAPMLYFAGRNDGVAEELTLKTNEITGKKSAYLEGTYAVHGIEEVMNADEAVILVNPFKAEVEKFQDVLVTGVGLTVIAIASEQTMFPTIIIPECRSFDQGVQLAAGWNLLVEIGLAMGKNLDQAVRARKVGNEFLEKT